MKQVTKQVTSALLTHSNSSGAHQGLSYALLSRSNSPEQVHGGLQTQKSLRHP